MTLADVQRAATAAGLVFGVDLAARDSATVGGMASTNAGGLRTVRYGNMGEQVSAWTWRCPTGRWCTGTARFGRTTPDTTWRRCSSAPKGTLGVITGLDLRLHPTPTHRVTAICGFADLDALVDAGRAFRDMDGIAALELIDARASALTAEHLGVAAPVDGAWQLLIELAADTDQTERLADALEHARLAGEPAVGVDVNCAAAAVAGPRIGRRGARRVRAAAEIRCVAAVVGDRRHSPRESGELVAEHAPDAIPVLFGHIGEGNLHLNVLRVCARRRARGRLYSAMMALIAAQRRQRQLRTRRRHPQARLRRDVAHRCRHRRDARRQGRLRSGGIPQRGRAVLLVARPGVPTVRARPDRAGMPAVGAERVILRLLIGELVAGRTLEAGLIRAFVMSVAAEVQRVIRAEDVWFVRLARRLRLLTSSSG